MQEQTIIILAGGLGLRMGIRTDKIQKCILPVDGKPMLGHILDSVYKVFKSPRIIIATGWQNETVREYVNRYHKRRKIDFINDPRIPGTKRSTIMADYLCKTSFLLLPGNVVVPPSAMQQLVYSFHTKGDAAPIAELLLARRYHLMPTDSAVRVRGGKVVEIITPASLNSSRNIFMNTGIMYCREKFFYFLRCTPTDATSISDTIAFGLRHRETFSFTRHVGTWRHFTVPSDLTAKIKP